MFRTHNNSVRLTVEGMEERVCQSSNSAPDTVTPALSNRILTVQGTSTDDDITVSKSGTNVVVAGKSFASSKFDKIVIVGEGGNDRISVSESITKYTRIFGGNGNDTVFGGGGTDAIYGGNGNDTLYGRKGADTIWGGAGGDECVGGAGVDSVHSNSPQRTDKTSSAIEKEILRLTNLERAKFGLSALTFNSQLNYASALHASNMATRSNSIGNDAAHNHTLSGTTMPTMSSRMDYVGYDYSSVRENIAYGYQSAADVVKGWMNSPGHRANILSTDITEIGIGVQKNASGTLFFCQNFGTRK